LLILYTADLPSLIGQRAMSSHLYADDMQIYGACRAVDTKQFVGRLGECFDYVASRISSNRLQLNANKTEFLWLAMPCLQDQLSVHVILIGGHDTTPAASASNLGVYFDSDLSISRTHRRHYSALLCITSRTARHSSVYLTGGHAAACDVTGAVAAGLL
jgi:hypothetical protein